VCVDEVNECDDNCEVNDVDIDDSDEVSRHVHNMDDIVSSGCVNDDVLKPVHTVDVMTDECVDESGGIDGRMNDCLSNCCRDVSSCLMWLILCIILVATAVCDALLDPVPHIRVRSMSIGGNGCNFVGQLTHKLRKFSGCRTAFEVPGYHRALSLVSLYGDGSQQLWQLSDSTSVCVSDACSGIGQSLSRFDMSITASGSQRASHRRRGG